MQVVSASVTFEAESPVKKFLKELQEMSSKGIEVDEVIVSKDTFDALWQSIHAPTISAHNFQDGYSILLFGVTIVIRDQVK